MVSDRDLMRFSAKYEEHESGCWLWIGARFAKVIA